MLSKFRDLNCIGHIIITIIESINLPLRKNELLKENLIIK